MPRATGVAQARSREHWRSLVTGRNATFIAAAALVQGSHAVYYAFGTLFWQRLGIADMTIAALWAEGAVAEVALFYAGARLVRRMGPGALMAAGGAGAVVRWTLTPFIASAPVLAVVQPLHALSFAATHLGAMHYLARRVPAGAAGNGAVALQRTRRRRGRGACLACGGRALRALWRRRLSRDGGDGGGGRAPGASHPARGVKRATCTRDRSPRARSRARSRGS